MPKQVECFKTSGTTRTYPSGGYTATTTQGSGVLPANTSGRILSVQVVAGSAAGTFSIGDGAGTNYPGLDAYQTSPSSVGQYPNPMDFHGLEFNDGLSAICTGTAVQIQIFYQRS